jgi:hypothetical protein
MEREAKWLAPLLAGNTEYALKQILIKGYRDLKFLSIKPGAAISDELSTELQQRIYKYKLIDQYHQHVDGTSVSVAIVASVVAQMLEANPALTPQQIRDTLITTAKRLPSVSPLQQGGGMVDATRTVEAVLKIKG